MVKLLQVFQDEQRSLDLAIKADLLYNDGDCANLNYPGKHQIVSDTNSVHGKKLRCTFRDDNKLLFYNSVFRRSKLLVKKNTLFNFFMGD